MWAAVLAWLIAKGPQIAVSLAITILEKTGAISTLQADGVRVGTHVIRAVENLKTEDTYPTGVNGQTESQPVSIQAWRGEQ
jgi:hypothetical protein